VTLDLCWNVVCLSYVRVAHSKKRNFGLVSDPSARNQLVLTSLTSNDGFCNFNLCKLLIVLTRFQFSKKKQLKVGSLPPHYFLEKKKNEIRCWSLYFGTSRCVVVFWKQNVDEMRVRKEYVLVFFSIYLFSFLSII